MSGMDRLTDEALIAGWDDLKDSLPSSGHDAAEVLFDYGDKLADALSRRASQDAPAPVAWRWRDDVHQAWNHINWEPKHMDYVFVEPLYATSAPSDGLREALERIAEEQMYRSGYDQTDISVEPVLSASEMQEIARAALAKIAQEG